MPLTYQQYDRTALKGTPNQHFVGKWRVDYLAFSLPENASKPPLIVLGGAFQNFNSYKFCVERIQVDFPVILVDLPSLGNNDQLAPELGMEDLADLLHEFVVQLEIPKASLMGLSLGSVVASTFAYKHPQLTEKLIVAGIIPRPRKAWRMLLEESVRVLDAQRMQEFGHAVVLYLVNYGKLDETGMTPTARRLFQRQMAHFTENEQARYRINAARLLEVEGILGYPTCETLVTTGEYDSFTLPHENGAFAAKCPNSSFVLIEGADHLPQLQKRDESLELFSAFLRGVPLSEVAGVRVIPKADIPKLERRGHERVVPRNPGARVSAESMIGEAFRFDQPVRVVDLSFFGCCLQLQAPVHSLAEHTRDLTLRLQAPEFARDLLVFEYDEQGLMRCIFLHGNIQKAEEWAALLRNEEFFVRKADSQKTPGG
ncbi:MAG: alpha/beta fold hydrolase [Gammaproteobacteria bacterium]